MIRIVNRFIPVWAQKRVTGLLCRVKNVSLLSQDGVGLFPDAVTVRGQKHLEELMLVRQLGYRAVFVLCLHSGIEKLMPADQIDPVAARYSVRRRGVEILAYGPL